VKPEHIYLYKVYRKDALVNPNGKPVKSEDKATEYSRKGARAKTINFKIDTLRTVFNLVIKWDYLKENSTQNITRLKVSDSKPPRFLTVEECERFVVQQALQASVAREFDQEVLDKICRRNKSG